MCWVTKNKTKPSYSDYADGFLPSPGQTEGAGVGRWCSEKWV